MKSKRKKIFVGVLVSFTLFFLYYWFSQKTTWVDYTPPGCLPRNGPTLGGCYSKNVIKNLIVYGWKPPCLKVTSNNCVSAHLDINNRCPDTSKVFIEGRPILTKNSSLYYSLDNGRVIYGSNGRTYPLHDENITLNGTFNGLPFRIRYIKTKALCD